MAPHSAREYQTQMAIESKNMFEKLQAYQKNPNPQNKKELEEAQAAFNEISVLAREAVEAINKPRAAATPAPTPAATPAPAPAAKLRPAAIEAPAPAPAPAGAPPPEDSTMMTSAPAPAPAETDLDGKIRPTEESPAAPKRTVSMDESSNVEMPAASAAEPSIARPVDPPKAAPPPKRSLLKQLTGRCAKTEDSVDPPPEVPALAGAISNATNSI